MFGIPLLLSGILHLPVLATALVGGGALFLPVSIAVARSSAPGYGKLSVLAFYVVCGGLTVAAAAAGFIQAWPVWASVTALYGTVFFLSIAYSNYRSLPQR